MQMYQIGGSIRAKLARARVVGPAPKFGAHTREVLAEFGYSPDQIDSALAKGVVADKNTQDGVYWPH